MLLGQELAYVAAVGLLSFSLSALFALALVAVRAGRRGEGWFVKGVPLVPRGPKSWSRDPVTWALLAGLTLVTAFYLPLVADIVHRATRQGTPIVAPGPRGLSGLRLLIPYVPGVHPGESFWTRALDDAPEVDTVGGGSPVWFLLAAGGIGLAFGRARRLSLVPFALLFVLSVVHDPKSLPILSVFPWFSFARTAGRLTIVLPVLAFLPLLAVDFIELSKRRRLLVSGLLALEAALSPTRASTAAPRSGS